MSSRKLSTAQIQSLDLQTDQLFESFRRAVSTQVLEDAIWSSKLFNAYGEVLWTVTHSVFSDWEGRDTQRARVFDRYLLPHVLGEGPAITLAKVIESRERFGDKPQAKKTDIAADTLIWAIDNPRVPYSRIQAMSMHLGDAHDFAGVVRAWEHAREKYRKPE